MPGPSTPPPCAQTCWTWLTTTGWVYTDSCRRCGHYFDVWAGVWRWSHLPARTATEGPQHP